MPRPGIYQASVFNGGLIELIGADEQIDQNDFSGSVEVDFDPDSLSTGLNKVDGEITQIMLYSTGGDELEPTGELFFFSANPSIASGDTSTTAAIWKTCIGSIAVAASDWHAGTTQGGAVATLRPNGPLVFARTSSLYVAFLYTLATSYNSAGGDNELLQLDFWFRRMI